MPTRTTASLISGPQCNLLMHKVYDDSAQIGQGVRRGGRVPERGGRVSGPGLGIRSQAVASVGSRPSTSLTLLSSTSPARRDRLGTEIADTPDAAGPLEVQHRGLGGDPCQVGASEQVTTERKRLPVEVVSESGALS